jgi:hypothetical protein
MTQYEPTIPTDFYNAGSSPGYCVDELVDKAQQEKFESFCRFLNKISEVSATCAEFRTMHLDKCTGDLPTKLGWLVGQKILAKVLVEGKKTKIWRLQVFLDSDQIIYLNNLYSLGSFSKFRKLKIN